MGQKGSTLIVRQSTGEEKQAGRLKSRNFIAQKCFLSMCVFSETWEDQLTNSSASRQCVHGRACESGSPREARQWKLCIFNESLNMDGRIGRERSKKRKDEHEEAADSDRELAYRVVSALNSSLRIGPIMNIKKNKIWKKQSQESDQCLCSYTVHTAAQLSCDFPVFIHLIPAWHMTFDSRPCIDITFGWNTNPSPTFNKSRVCDPNLQSSCSTD